MRINPATGIATFELSRGLRPQPATDDPTFMAMVEGVGQMYRTFEAAPLIVRDRPHLIDGFRSLRDRLYGEVLGPRLLVVGDASPRRFHLSAAELPFATSAMRVIQVNPKLRSRAEKGDAEARNILHGAGQIIRLAKIRDAKLA